MRTFHDAKVMAKSLRESLSAKDILLSHSACLEITAQQFGFANWNTLSAKLTNKPTHEQVHCSFCGKSHRDVQIIAEGGCKFPRQELQSCVFICEECTGDCTYALAECRADGRVTEKSVEQSK